MSKFIDVMAFEDQTFENVAVKSNVAGRKSEIFRLTPPVGICYFLPSVYITLFKLNKSGGDQITDHQAKLWFMVKRAGQETLEEAQEFDYLPWFHLTVAQQQNKKFKENFRVDVRGTKGVTIPPGDVLVLELRSSDVASWAATDGSRIFFKVLEHRVVVA